ncbi:hypothetical protein QJS10_CPA10g01899 [Acorus calamus]|uniref:Nucleotide-diphospho-sugar transferase n=1 Tax=Acorus calamus TaxID=4465 RepID=A0AAV9E1G1_ACOCL|nr:hypothetical protein QJS10_CPA10g01899 [Acorus calamus]
MLAEAAMGIPKPLRGLLILLFLFISLSLLLTMHELQQRASYSSDPSRLKNPTTEEKQKQKYDHLILGPAAGQGLSDRLQCDGLKALNRTSLPVPSQVAEVSDKISFVTVFTIYNISQSPSMNEKVTVGKMSYTKQERSLAILNVFVNFIQVNMPRSDVIILTDPASEPSINRSGVTLLPIQGDYSREKLMLQRIRSYIAFLQSRLEELSQNQDHVNHYIFTDSDVAVIDDFGDIFQKYPHFHLALTFRNNKDQPLNSGFIAVRGSHEGLLKAKIFLQEVLDVYSSRFLKASRMLGDQLALAWVITSHHSFDAKRFTRHEAFLNEIHGVSVLFLPCAIYNWTPPEGAGQFHGMPLDVKVVHFKGSRKRLMLESWEFYKSSSDLFDMLCLILSSGRTKYDF